MHIKCKLKRSLQHNMWEKGKCPKTLKLCFKSVQFIHSALDIRTSTYSSIRTDNLNLTYSSNFYIVMTFMTTLSFWSHVYYIVTI